MKDFGLNLSQVKWLWYPALPDFPIFKTLDL